VSQQLKRNATEDKEMGGKCKVRVESEDDREQACGNEG